MPAGVIYLLCFAAGAFLGWLIAQLARRAIAPQPSDARLESELRAQIQQHTAELTSLRADLTTTRTALATAEANRDAAQRLLAESRNFFTENLAAAKTAQEKSLLDLRETFRALSADALKQTQPEFLRLANETFAKFQEGAKGDLAQRQQAIATIVEPLKQHLDTYQKRLAESENHQALTLGEVKKQLESLAQHSLSLSSETLQLRRVLSSSQARGRWGEQTLRRVVEAAGMSAHCDFSEQTVAGDAKPDLLVHLPGDRVIIVDAKVPELEFLAAIDGTDAMKRAEAVAAHAAKLKSTIKALAERDYPRQFPNAIDFVVLFVPAESLFSVALEGDQDLVLWASQRQILLATPASLIALLRSVSICWLQHAQTENAREIAAAAGELFARVAKFTEHLERMRAGLERATSAFNDAVGSYERMVRPSGEKLLKLGGVPGGKDLADLTPLDTTLRLPQG